MMNAQVRKSLPQYSPYMILECIPKMMMLAYTPPPPPPAPHILVYVCMMPIDLGPGSGTALN